MIVLKILPASKQRLASTEELDRFEQLLSAHDQYTSSRQREGGAGDLDTHPFANFVLDALRYVRMDMEATDSTTLTEIEKSLALLGVTKFHYELSSHGFAHTVSQAFVSTYGPKTAQSLQGIADALKRESGFKHPYFHIN